jgi:fatty acid desaturase
MAATTAALRIPARELIAREELVALRQRVEWKGIALIAHAWTVILGSIALVAIFPNPLTYIVAVILIGSRQLGLAILMHDGAHGCLSRNEKRNLFLSQWFCAYPVFAETLAYRRYHLTHHMRTQQEDDPDLVLSAPFPITKASYRRKFWRDISGQTGYEQRKAQILNALGDPHGHGGSACGTSTRSSARRSSPIRSCSSGSRRPVCGGPIRCSGSSRCSPGRW